MAMMMAMVNVEAAYVMLFLRLLCKSDVLRVVRKLQEEDKKRDVKIVVGCPQKGFVEQKIHSQQ